MPNPDSAASIFDRDILKLKKKRFQKRFETYNFLHTHCAKLVIERLEDITIPLPNGAYLGNDLPKDLVLAIQETARSETLIHMNMIQTANAQRPCIIGDEEFLPFGQEKLDLIIANLNLHQTNDLPGALIQIKRALKPDGLFIAGLFGGETLWQLRESLNYAEQKHYDGLSPRVHPFADKQQMGALLQRAGYALPVVDSEMITVTYPNIFKLMVDLRGMGETNIVYNRLKTTPSKEFFHTAGKYYADNFSDNKKQLEATFEMIFLLGWAPSETQQKPLRPGSAQNRLADALNTEEISTGEKVTS